MNADLFEDYFEKMLKYLLRALVVVMDNVSYYSRRVEKTPISSWRKQEIIDWLTSKDIPFQANVIRKQRFMKYDVEFIPEKHNIIVLRLTPYNCELNPTELTRAQVEGFEARQNVTFKMKDVELLLE